MASYCQPLRFSAIGRNLRQLSASAAPPKLTTVTLDARTAIATLTLNRLPANALSLELMQQVRQSVQQLEQSKCRGLILTSASDRIFCAGLDLKEVYKPDVERLAQFWCALQNMWRAVFGTAIPTVALINGHALAGGCMLATCCDYRVMLPNFTIGLSETRAGIAVPKWVMDTYVNVVRSRRIAEADLLASRVYSSEEALQVGLVDAVAESKEQAMELSLAFLRNYAPHTLDASTRTKLQFRAQILADFEQGRECDLDIFIQGIQRKDVQEHLGNYLEALKNKTAKHTK